MGLISTFKSDLQKEQNLAVLLDEYYRKHLKTFDFERVTDLKRQKGGIDLVFTSKVNSRRFYIDEKAQLDYVNEELPTFAFELNYYKNSKARKGWLYDSEKKTHFYSLITAIYSDEPGKFTSFKITFVNRKKLIRLLKSRKISEERLKKLIAGHPKKQGKVILEQLHHRKEGYLYFSAQNKAEKPTNLILKLDFLIQKGVAKRFA